MLKSFAFQRELLLFCLHYIKKQSHIYLHSAAFSLWMSALSGKVSIISSNANQLLSTDEGVTPDPAQSLCRARETLQRTEGHPVLFQNNTAHMQGPGGK